MRDIDSEMERWREGERERERIKQRQNETEKEKDRKRDRESMRDRPRESEGVNEKLCSVSAEKCMWECAKKTARQKRERRVWTGQEIILQVFREKML